MSGPGAWAEEVEQVNRLIVPGARFHVERDTAVGRGPRAGPCDGLRGVLTVRRPDGSERAAASTLDEGARGRARLLMVASCLAECAMDLGLGARAWRAGTAWKETERPESP